MPEFTARLRTPRLATAPATPVAGEVYFDTTVNKLMWWSGTSWVVAATDSTGGTIGTSAALATAVGAAVTFGPGWSAIPLPTTLTIEPSDAFTFSGNAVTVKDAGWYDVSASVGSNSGSVNTIFASLSTSATPGDGDIANSSGATIYSRANVAGNVKLAAGAKVYLHGYTNSTGIALNCPNFSIVRVGGPKGDKGDPGGLVSQVPAYTITNVTTDRTFNATSTSINELAAVLGTLITDLRTAGVILP